MNPRRVLLISYYFPPLGGAGIDRPLALFRHLSRFGYDCHVLTVKPVLYRVYEPELLAGLDSSRVFRSGSRDPSRIMYLLGLRSISSGTADKSRVISKMFFPDGKAGWIPPAVRLAKKLHRQYGYDLLISTSPPISAHVIAGECSESLQIPWVADFQDFWMLDKAEDYFESEKQQMKAKELLQKISDQAKAVVANNESVGKYVNASSIIPNCFDLELAKGWKTTAREDQFVIGLFGTIAESNPVEPMLKVLKTVRSRRPDMFSKIRVLQVGQVDLNWLMPQVINFELHDIFEIKQYQSRAKAVELLSQASMFYLGVWSEKGRGITPVRLYTLLASGRPILAYAPPESEIDKALVRAINCFRFDDSTINQSCEFLYSQWERFQSGQSQFTIVPDYAEEFSAERITERFAKLFDRELDGERP